MTVISIDVRPAAAQENAAEQPAEIKTFTLHIQDRSGAPVVGAKVLIFSFGDVSEKDDEWPVDEYVFHQSDSTGKATLTYPARFEAGAIMRETTHLRIAIEHPAFQSKLINELESHRQRTVVLNSSPELAISAIDENGAAIRSFGVETTQLRPRWRTDPSGTKRTRSVFGYQFQAMLVSISQSGTPLFSDILRIDMSSSMRDLNVQRVILRPGIRLCGKVSNEVPRPIVNGQVIVHCLPRPLDQLSESLTWDEKAEIEPDGTFVFPSLPATGVIQIFASCKGWIIKNQLDENDFITGQAYSLDELIEKKLTENLTLPFEPTGIVELHVKRPVGSPVKGAQVIAGPLQLLHGELGPKRLGSYRRSFDYLKNQISPKHLYITPDFFSYGPATIAATDENGIAIIDGIPFGKDHEAEIHSNGKAVPAQLNLGPYIDSNNGRKNLTVIIK